eukprot:s1435_g1.t1
MGGQTCSASLLGGTQFQAKNPKHKSTYQSTAQKDKEQAEVFLGFKLSSLVESPLTQRCLRSFFRLEFLQFDAMHHLFSNGLISQELGLWFQACNAEAGVTADHMARYMRVAWTPVKGANAETPRPDLNFCEKLWKLDAGFRGDAQACLHALPLAVAYGEDMLRGYFPSLHPALDSLLALHNVVICVKACKANAALLELCSQELATPLSADKLGTFFAGKSEVSCALTRLLAAETPVQMASALEHRSIRYGKGLFILLSNGSAAEIVCALHTGKEFALLVDMLKPLGDHTNPGRRLWQRAPVGESSRALLPITKDLNSECSQCMYVRHDSNKLWLLQ